MSARYRSLFFARLAISLSLLAHFSHVHSFRSFYAVRTASTIPRFISTPFPIQPCLPWPRRFFSPYDRPPLTRGLQSRPPRACLFNPLASRQNPKFQKIKYSSLLHCRQRVVIRLWEYSFPVPILAADNSPDDISIMVVGWRSRVVHCSLEREYRAIYIPTHTHPPKADIYLPQCTPHNQRRSYMVQSIYIHDCRLKIN